MNKYRVYDSNTMKLIEKNTANQLNIDINDLVYSAGKYLYEAIISHQIIKKEDSILILFGYGNNGADALVVGSYLQKNNYNVSFYKTSNQINDFQKQIINKSSIQFIDHVGHIQDFNVYDVIIDGMFGIGLNRLLETRDIEMIEKVNQSKCKLISIDIPSGIHPNTGLYFDLSYL